MLNLSRWYDTISAEQWRKELMAGLSDSEFGRMKLSAHTGSPLGSNCFLSKLENFSGDASAPCQSEDHVKNKAKNTYKPKKTNAEQANAR